MRTTGDLVRLRTKYSEKDVCIVTIYSARSSRAAFQTHVRKECLNYTAIYDECDRIGKAYCITDAGRSCPVNPTFLIGRDGKVVWEKTEVRHWRKSVSVLEELIDRELARGKRQTF